MAKKFPLLLLDADVVIELFRLGIWDSVIERCGVHLAHAVAETEAHFFHDEHGERQDFDLAPYKENGGVTVFDVTITDLQRVTTQFGPTYVEKLDPGETQSLVYLLNSADTCQICSADRIVYRVLGNLNLGEQGVSLCEVLDKVGLGRPLEPHFGKKYRQKWTTVGSQDRIQDRGWHGL